MAARDEPLEPLAPPERAVAVAADAPNPAGDLASVYRDFPGLRSLIQRRVHDPELAADVLQDAAVTTLQKLRDGRIAQPDRLGGFVYRVALNHLRNYRRKDRTAVSSSDALEQLPAAQEATEEAQTEQRDWSLIMRQILDELPAARDREILVRLYLRDETKADICRDLGLSEEHFHRVIFRARNRFRALLEARGFEKGDFLSAALAALALGALLALSPGGDRAAAVANVDGGRVGTAFEAPP